MFQCVQFCSRKLRTLSETLENRNKMVRPGYFPEFPDSSDDEYERDLEQFDDDIHSEELASRQEFHLPTQRHIHMVNMSRAPVNGGRSFILPNMPSFSDISETYPLR